MFTPWFLPLFPCKSIFSYIHSFATFLSANAYLARRNIHSIQKIHNTDVTPAVADPMISTKSSLFYKKRSKSVIVAILPFVYSYVLFFQQNCDKSFLSTLNFSFSWLNVSWSDKVWTSN